MGILLRRDQCIDQWGRVWDNCSGSAWNNWGRWVAFGVIVAFAFLIFFIFACINARRRRTHGLRPYPGTSWMAPPPYQTNQAYHADPYYQQPPPPQYTPNQQQAYGYFGGQQQTGIELQQPQHPQNAYYQGGNRVYQPAPPPPIEGEGKV